MMEVLEVDYNKNIWKELDIKSNKNLGEAECIQLCLDNKNYVFLTDDYSVWKKGKKFLQERSQYFLFSLIEFDFLNKEEKLKVLEARNKIRKIARNVYRIIKSEIQKQKD